MLRPVWFIALALLAWAMPEDIAAQGNINRGRQLAEDRHCASCHSVENPYTGAVPRIDGQKIYYLAKQLRAFRDDEPSVPYSPSKANARRHPAMDWQAERMTDADIRDLSDYIASLPCEPVRETVKLPPVTPAKLQRCAYCHGDNGNNPYDVVPNLGGQKRQYLLNELLRFKISALDKPLEHDQERFNRMMAPAVYDLTDLEIAELANFYSQQSCRPSR
jgi:cytochrome c553